MKNKLLAVTLLSVSMMAQAEPVSITINGGSQTQDFEWTLTDTTTHETLWVKYGIRLKQDIKPGRYRLKLEGTLVKNKGYLTFTVVKDTGFTGMVNVK